MAASSQRAPIGTKPSAIIAKVATGVVTSKNGIRRPQRERKRSDR